MVSTGINNIFDVLALFVSVCDTKVGGAGVLFKE